ncbi:transcription antitermination factor NusB, partial [Pelomonas sp. KK5]|uniref:transcription antitermination factor NusB n=1 Tax=Pelomonas sp. KK5 TaxID=1855730 RepID=UPI00351377E4
MNSPRSSPPSAPLHQLLLQVADTVQSVRSGRSLTELLARCPVELRAGTQALSFAVLRRLGGAEAARAVLAPKAPPPKVDALLVSALALLWPGEDAYAPHTLVDQAVAAVRKRAPASGGFVNAVLRRFLRERDAIVAAAEREPRGAWNHPDWWIERLKADWPDQWQDILRANNEHPPMSLRVNALHGTAEAYAQELAGQG